MCGMYIIWWRKTTMGTINVENTPQTTFESRQSEDCEASGSHNTKFTECQVYSADGTQTTLIQAICCSCDEVLGQWKTYDQVIEVVGCEDMGTCPHCGDIAKQERQIPSRKTDENTVWHISCWYKHHYGFEDTGDDPPVARNPNAPYTLVRTNTTTLAGEEVSWKEYLYPHIFQDYMISDFPTRQDLSPEQLTELKEWIQGENPTGDEKIHKRDFSLGEFPTKTVLLSGIDNELICPDCAHIFNPLNTAIENVKKFDDLRKIVNDGNSKLDEVMESPCPNCGSDMWFTHGYPVTVPSVVREQLSDRELQVIVLSVLDNSISDIATQLNVKETSVREYRNRARKKAINGKELYDELTKLGVLES